jgi:hypothetical protein
MSFGRNRLVSAFALVLSVLGCLFSNVAQAQQQLAGVHIDPSGVLRIEFLRVAADVVIARQAAARADLSVDVVKESRLRKISLNRLEAAVAALHANGSTESPEMKYLAGLTRITHVFYYPESQDIVIAGPAEGFYLDSTNRPVGMSSGRAVLELQDLVAALRAYSPTGHRENVISVSIDPTQEGLQRMNQFFATVSPNMARTNPRGVAQGLQKNLGMQPVTIQGISPNTHFAQVLVEADYRMKLIGIGLETPPVKITSYISKATARSGGNALHRWYFTPNYECVKVSADRNAMQLLGEGVQLVNEHEIVSATGTRTGTGKVDKASKQFAESFTRMYPKLAAKVPVYAQLRNLIDISVAAASIQQQDFYGKSGWNMETFGSEDKFPIASYPVPKVVESAVNAVIKGNTLMTPIGGGVNIQPRQALRQDRIQKDEDGQLEEEHSRVILENLKPGQWWWD